MSQQETVDKPIIEELAEYVGQSTLETFAMIAGEQLEIDSESTSQDEDCITGIISMTGDLTWSLLLQLPKEVAVDVAQKFAGFEIPFESQDMADVVGELANVLSGDISARCEAAGISANLTLPIVARGKDVILILPGDVATNTISFALSTGKFSITIAVGQPFCIRKSGG
ncbi:MAG: chemotaxis protein CheX [Armatimonadetes bacterium]|nr:chemotaxis protein CheX [Armatimonadota bacterium]